MQVARANTCLERKQSARLRSRWMARVLLAAFAIALASRAAGQAAPRGNPSLTSYSPTQGTQGTTVTLTFTGANFTPRQLKLLFTPSQGLTVSSISAVSATQIVAQVQIASTAAVGSYRVDFQDADHDMIAANSIQCGRGSAATAGLP